LNSRLKLVILNLIDAALLNAAVLAALALRFDGDVGDILPYARVLLGITPFYTVGMLLLMNLSGTNRALWRYAGVPTFLTILRTLFFGYFLAFLINLVPDRQLLPKSVIILTWVLATGLILISRLVWKILRSQPARRGQKGDRRILIAGAGDIGAALAMELLRRRDYPGHPIGFVDDAPHKIGRKVEDLPVLGPMIDLPRLIGERRIDEVLIAAPSAPARLVRQIVTYCQEAGVECRTVPALSDYVAGKGALGQLRDVQIEDLLGREPVPIDFEGIAGRIRGRTVLVTGAAGSIGSELCRQLARFAPKRLVALDHSENRLCYLGLDLGESHPELDVLYTVGDIRDEFGLEELFQIQKPEFVFHAAAHKHVNLLENAPREAILNNIMGTRNLAHTAAAHGVETFVLISTDKAVNPTSVMGASKRGCEILLQGMAGKSRTTFVAVRFGNVLGSDGSVLPIFKRQLAHGGPLTVTHPEARRYFMTIPEASQLVIQAALLGDSGDVFVLDMGEQVRILDVAEQLIRLTGLRPGIDVPIRFIGLRPGEKLEEELLTDSEQTRVTRHAKIFRWELDPVDPVRVEGIAQRLISLAHHASSEEIRAVLTELVPEYRRIQVAALPAKPVKPAEPAAAPAAARVLGPKPEPQIKRLLDVGVSISFLALLSPVAVGVLILYRLAGAGRVRFVREQRIGRNRREGDRRRPSMAREIPIDRRGEERRVRRLPGPPFVSYRMIPEHPPQGAWQKRLAVLLQRYRLDRLLYLWNVLRGEMSLVGPAARLVEDASFSQDWTTAYIYSRRPGLVGPGTLFGNDREGSRRLETLYDGYYSKFGGIGLDFETLVRSVPRILRGDETVEP
jgi:FlaA1/EpsC-like NDP-sugar epimerase/lipopolysaccharide/colanic/teichoic acid biosynthesis glycosyltransferase